VYQWLRLHATFDKMTSCICQSIGRHFKKFFYTSILYFVAAKDDDDSAVRGRQLAYLHGQRGQHRLLALSLPPATGPHRQPQARQEEKVRQVW